MPDIYKTPSFKHTATFYFLENNKTLDTVCVCVSALQDRTGRHLPERIKFELIENPKEGKFSFDTSTWGNLAVYGPRGNVHLPRGTVKWLHERIGCFERFDANIILLGD